MTLSELDETEWSDSEFQDQEDEDDQSEVVSEILFLTILKNVEGV